MRADLDEGAVVGAGGGDGLAEPHRVAHIGHPVVGVEERCVTGILDRGDHRDGREPGTRSASASRSSGRIGSIIAVWEATSMLTRRANMFCSRRRGDDGVDRVGRSGDHGLTRRGIHRHRHPGVVGDQRLGGGGVEFQQRHRTLPASPAISRDRVAITRNPSAGVNAPATTAAVTSPIECPITASGCTP